MLMYTFYAQHRTAIESSVEVIRRVRSDMLTLPTPCAGWTLADLLTHMTAQHHGFAAAACGDGREQAVWHAESYAVEVTADPVGSYASAADEVLRAFATDGVEDTLFALPELGPEITVPGAVALGFHFVDYVVHGWDVATTLGRPYRLPADVITAALPIAMAVPDGEIRDDAAFPFARSVEPTGTGADVHDDFAQLLRHLVRDVDGVAATSIVNSGTGHRREG